MHKLQFQKYLFPVFYVLAMLLVVFYAWNEQKIIQHRDNTPLYRNLMDYDAYIKRGFSNTNCTNINELHESKGWYQYETVAKNVMYSPLPDLPKRKFLSPFGKDKEEFTILIPVEIDDRAISFLRDNPFVIPGLHFPVIGESWEVYFNGTLVKSEMYAYTDKNGKIKIKERRPWRNAYFYFDRSLIVPGTNILSFRIIGDPAFIGTGLSLKTHHYLEDYSLIEKRMQRFPLLIVCAIFGFIAVYYFMLFLFIKDKKEIFYLYFSIFSILLCVFTFTRHNIVNILIPNAYISMRLEYASLMLMVPMFCMFVESIVRRKITRVSKYYLYYCLFLTITQIIFCNQYCEEAIRIWNVTVILYGSYFLFYKLIYYYFWDKGGPRKKSVTGFASYSIINAMVGMISLYICGIYEILQVMFFRNDFSFFQYCLFVIHFGMVFNLAHRFGGMYNRLKQTNIVLQKKISELENLKIDRLSFNLVSNRAFYDGSELPLSPKEFALLYMLAQNSGKTLSAKQLYESIWQLEYQKENPTLRNHISSIKKKLADFTDDIQIDNIRGEGYSLVMM